MGRAVVVRGRSRRLLLNGAGHRTGPGHPLRGFRFLRSCWRCRLRLFLAGAVLGRRSHDLRRRSASGRWRRLHGCLALDWRCGLRGRLQRRPGRRRRLTRSILLLLCGHRGRGQDERQRNRRYGCCQHRLPGPQRAAMHGILLWRNEWPSFSAYGWPKKAGVGDARAALTLMQKMGACHMVWADAKRALAANLCAEGTTYGLGANSSCGGSAAWPIPAN